MQNQLSRILYARNLREHDFARRVGLTQSHLNRIKNGRVVPSLETALRICAALDLRVEEVFRLDGGRPTHGRRRSQDPHSAACVDPSGTFNARASR